MSQTKNLYVVLFIHSPSPHIIIFYELQILCGMIAEWLFYSYYALPFCLGGDDNAKRQWPACSWQVLLTKKSGREIAPESEKTVSSLPVFMACTGTISSRKEQQDKTDTDMGYSHACVRFVFLVFPRCRSPPSESLKTTHFSNSWR